MNRRGVTLVELLVGLVLLAILGAAVTHTLTTVSRTTVRSLQALANARTMVTTSTLVREELGSSDSGEVRLANSAAIDFGRTVGSAAVCGTGGSMLRLRASDWLGSRWPEGGRDEAVLLTDPSSGHWAAKPIVGVGGGLCPDGSAAILLTLDSDAGPAAFVRVAEPVELRFYLAGGSGWMGLAPASGMSPIQPFAGPLEAPFESVHLDADGLVISFRPPLGNRTVLRVPLGLP